MNTFNNRITSRFNRTSPMYANDNFVKKSVEKLSGEPDVINNAKKIDDLKDIKLTDINYVKTELLKRFGYTNNEKLMMANELIFKALLNQALKNGKLDIEDFDYINVSIRNKSSQYNDLLIKYYSEFIIKVKGKTFNSIEEVKDATIKDLKDKNETLEKLKTQLLQDKLNLEESNSTLTIEKTQLETDKGKLDIANQSLKNEKKQLENDNLLLVSERKSASEILRDEKIKSEEKIAKLKELFLVQKKSASKIL